VKYEANTVILNILLIVLVAQWQEAHASYAFYVGKNLGSGRAVLVGGTGEEVSSHWLVVAPRQTHPDGATIDVGVTKEAALPGELIQIPQARRNYKFLSMNYSNFKGFPTPLTNGGLNEFQVAVRDVWSPSRKELVEMTPNPQRGPQYSDLARIVLQRAKTAREGVELIGDLIKRYGYSTYGGNSHLIADPNEGWVVIEFAGGQGLWVAERLGPNDVRVLYPGYIEEVPLDFHDRDDYMGSDNLISFAQKRGWHTRGQPFNVREVYAAEPLRRGIWPKYVTPAQLERELKRMAPVTVSEMIGLVRDPRISDDEAGYGQVSRLKPPEHPELATLWVAPTGSVAAPFTPYFIAHQHVLPEFAQHRYLTKDAGRTFLDPQFQAQEATQFAGRVFKRLLYYCSEHPNRFLPEVHESFEALENNTTNELESVRETALILFQQDRPDLARKYLTDYSNGRAATSLRLGEALLASIEWRTKLLYGIRRPAAGAQINSRGGQTPNCLTDADPDQPANRQD